MSIINDAIHKHGLEKLNSLTKYPSIMTYHNFGEKGSLVESFVDDTDFSVLGQVFITEKIDGTNARIIFDGEDYIIGSREELLFAKDDRICNPQLGIANTIREIADRLARPEKDGLWILFGEVYGGNIGASSKQYTVDKTFGFRLFDIARVDLRILEESLDRISSWREHGGQKYVNVDALKEFAKTYKIETVPLLSALDGIEFPKDRMSVLKWLRGFSDTCAGINNSGKAEGVVVRTFDRSVIRKIRFEDYERTAKRENWIV